ncbi:MAG: WGR domain-containing protein, partial [Burkholderiaceae bacterium]
AIASALGQAAQAQSILGGLTQGARRTFTREIPVDVIRDEICAALQERGYQADLHVGSSQFRCDVAIRDTSGAGYVLGILLDNPHRPSSDIVERYVFQPQILRNFGWQVLDLPCKDWLHDRQAVLQRIETVLQRNEDPALFVELGPLVEVKLPEFKPSPLSQSAALMAKGESTTQPEQQVSNQAQQPGSVAGLNQTEERILRFEQGNSSKFWQVIIKGNELLVNYGRIGTRGQTLHKQFDTAERARKEMEKLVAEKLRKGYVDGTAE